MNNRTKILLAASLATALSGPLMAQGEKAPAKGEGGEKVHCYGVNKCKGVGDCSGAGHSCKGHNECARKGFIEMDEETCLKLDGGSLTAPKS
jgi:uncharacterized membrane protein